MGYLWVPDLDWLNVCHAYLLWQGNLEEVMFCSEIRREYYRLNDTGDSVDTLTG